MSDPSPNGTADRILTAARLCFGQSGFDGTSARDIAQQAGVNKALVFYHFGSKELLFERVLQGYYDRQQQALRAAMDPGRPMESRLHGLIDAYLDYMIDNDDYARLVQREVAGSGAATAIVERNLASLLAWTADALSEVAPPDGPTAARHLFVTLSGAVINYFTYAPVLTSSWGQDPLSDAGLAERRQHLHWLADALLTGLGAPGSRE
jgi:AcrR family transcriptional regulator